MPAIAVVQLALIRLIVSLALKDTIGELLMVVCAKLVQLVVLLVIQLMFVIVVSVDIICSKAIVWPALPIVVLVRMVRHVLPVPKVF